MRTVIPTSWPGYARQRAGAAPTASSRAPRRDGGVEIADFRSSLAAHLAAAGEAAGPEPVPGGPLPRGRQPIERWVVAAAGDHGGRPVAPPKAGRRSRGRPRARPGGGLPPG